jgi:hypothetical protein
LDSVPTQPNCALSSTPNSSALPTNNPPPWATDLQKYFQIVQKKTMEIINKQMKNKHVLSPEIKEQQIEIQLRFFLCVYELIWESFLIIIRLLFQIEYFRMQ